MSNSPDRQVKSIVTTSWDDGHPLDLRIAELLAKYGFRGTFYVPVTYDGNSLLRPAEIRNLVDMGMEVGSHTFSHSILTGLHPDRLLEELVSSKRYLEDLLGSEVTSICYPKGKFNRIVVAKAAEAGYSLGRTTIGFHTDRKFEPLRLPVSVQFYPHRKLTHVRHAVKEGNFSGLASWMFRWMLVTDLGALCSEISEHVFTNGGVFHLWGHSWEIEEADLWVLLESLLQRLSNHQHTAFLTNAEILGA